MNPIIKTHDLITLASGDRLGLQSYHFQGNDSDKKAYIQANLHGSEIVGNAVIYQLIEFLAQLNPEQLNGEIVLVPVCNPIAVNQRSHFFSSGRYNPYDGKDWNRIFWDYEKEQDNLHDFIKTQINLPVLEIQKNYLALILQAFENKHKQKDQAKGLSLKELYRYQLQALSLDANYVIDIHSSSNQCIDYLYCFHHRENSAPYFGLDYGILMREYDGDAFDEAFMKPWLALERQLAKMKVNLQFDVEAWTLELGSGMVMNPDSVKKGIEGIKNYLAYKGMLSTEKLTSPIKEITFFRRSQMQRYYAPTGGMIQQRLPLYHPVAKGDRLYQLLCFNKEEQPPTVKDIYVEEDGFIFDRSINHAVNQGEYVLTVISDQLPI
ncbi:MAG: succinylglutamate desuccinylase/aspartoacylase family protein [Microcystaceae cyanobacterium]